MRHDVGGTRGWWRRSRWPASPRPRRCGAGSARLPREPLTQFSVALRKSEELQPPPTSGGGRIAISPDGRQIVFVGPGQGSSQLWLRRLDQLTSTPIAGTEGGYSPFFSPDGRQVGFIKNGNTLRIASLDGTPTVTLIDTANTTSADWSSDGWVYVEGGAGIIRVRPTGGPVEPVYAVSAERHEVGAEFLNALPDGGLLFRLRYGGKGQNEFQIGAMKVPKGPVKLLTRGVFARYAPTGHLIVVTAEGKLIAFRSMRPSSSSPARRSRCWRASGSGPAGSAWTWPSRRAARWCTPPAGPSGRGGWRG